MLNFLSTNVLAAVCMCRGCRIGVKQKLSLNWSVLTLHLVAAFKGGVAVQKPVKILALLKRGGSHPCQDIFGGFDIVHRG